MLSTGLNSKLDLHAQSANRVRRNWAKLAIGLASTQTLTPGSTFYVLASTGIAISTSGTSTWVAATSSGGGGGGTPLLAADASIYLSTGGGSTSERVQLATKGVFPFTVPLAFILSTAPLAGAYKVSAAMYLDSTAPFGGNALYGYVYLADNGGQGNMQLYQGNTLIASTNNTSFEGQYANVITLSTVGSTVALTVTGNGLSSTITSTYTINSTSPYCGFSGNYLDNWPVITGWSLYRSGSLLSTDSYPGSYTTGTSLYANTSTKSTYTFVGSDSNNPSNPSLIFAATIGDSSNIGTSGLVPLPSGPGGSGGSEGFIWRAGIQASTVSVAGSALSTVSTGLTVVPDNVTLAIVNNQLQSNMVFVASTHIAISTVGNSTIIAYAP